MCDEARRYWEAISMGDMKTANELARRVVDNLASLAQDARDQGMHGLSDALRLEARHIERGELAPYPKDMTLPLTDIEISQLKPGQHLTDPHGEDWVVASHPWRDPIVNAGRPDAWSVGVRRLRGGEFKRIDSGDRWRLSIAGQRIERTLTTSAQSRSKP